MTFHNMPVVRNYRTGRPIQSNERTLNRSEVVRRILEEKGLGLTNNQVHDFLSRQGLYVSDSLITVQRQRLREEL